MADLTPDEIYGATQDLQAAGSMDRVRDLCVDLEKKERDVVRLEEELKLAKQMRDRVRDRDLPEAMSQAQCGNFTLESGTKFENKDVVRASIPKAKWQEGLGWLRENGHGDLIKNEVTTTFAAGEDEKAVQCEAELKEQGLTVDRTERVHSQTLTAFVKRQLAAGVAIPMDILGVYVGKTVKITLP